MNDIKNMLLILGGLTILMIIVDRIRNPRSKKGKNKRHLKLVKSEYKTLHKKIKKDIKNG